MRYKSSLVNLIIRSLVESISIDLMTMLAGNILEGYDIYTQTGFPQSVELPRRDAARQITHDMRDRDLLPHFVGEMVKLHQNGFMGREYQILHLRNIIKELFEHGYIYDMDNSIFVENPEVRKTRNWGTLRSGHEYIFTFLRLDIVGNTELVKNNPEPVIKQTYSDLLTIVEQTIHKRNGRVWNWEGDGGLISFFFSNKYLLGTLSAMELLNEIFIYNQIHCKLNKPLAVRLAIDGGNCDYTENDEDLKKNETIKRVIQVEGKYTGPNTLTVTDVVYQALEGIIQKQFNRINTDIGTKCYNYHIRWEQ